MQSPKSSRILYGVGLAPPSCLLVYQRFGRPAMQQTLFRRVRALARECLPPTLAHAARDTSTLSSASTHGGADAGWMRDGQVRFVEYEQPEHLARCLLWVNGSIFRFSKLLLSSTKGTTTAALECSGRFTPSSSTKSYPGLSIL